MSVRIKVCGVTRLEDVERCVEAGVDAIGFNFHPPSPRALTPEAAVPLVRRVPKSVLTVGVFVHRSADEVRAIVEQTGLGAVQLHGDQDPLDYAGLGERIQVLRIPEGGGLPERASAAADWVMLDAWTPAFGGVGKQLDWRLAAGARARYGRPVMVAGGVTPENVEALLAQAAPSGVDVASGVELRPGVKDAARVRALVLAVRRFERNGRPPEETS